MHRFVQIGNAVLTLAGGLLLTTAAAVGAQRSPSGQAPKTAVARAVSATAAVGGRPALTSPAFAGDAAPGELWGSSFGSGSGNGGFVNYYTRRGRSQAPLGQLLGIGGPSGPGLSSPQGMAVDQHGNLYVAETGLYRIDVYAPGATSPTKVLWDPGFEPCGIAIGDDDTVYVGNIATAELLPGNVMAYAPGATFPTRVYKDANFGFIIGIGVDRHNNVFASYQYGLHLAFSTVVEFPNGSRKPVETGVQLGLAGTIALDVNGNVLVSDQDNGVSVYAPNPSFAKLGTLAIGGNSAGLAFDKRGTLLYVADSTNADLNVYRYDPQTFGTKLVNTIHAGFGPSILVSGVAVWPTLRTPI